jgi:hypothetical protein
VSGCGAGVDVAGGEGRGVAGDDGDGGGGVGETVAAGGADSGEGRSFNHAAKETAATRITPATIASTREPRRRGGGSTECATVVSVEAIGGGVSRALRGGSEGIRYGGDGDKPIVAASPIERCWRRTARSRPTSFKS